MSHFQFCQVMYLYLLMVSTPIMGDKNDSIAHSLDLPNKDISNLTSQYVYMSKFLSNGSSIKVENSTSTIAGNKVWIADCAQYNKTGNTCESCADIFVLWPATEAGEVANRPCPTTKGYPKLAGVAKRFCDENGTWFYLADFEECIDVILEYDKKKVLEKEQEMKMYKNSTYIFFGGFGLSNIATIIAIAIFIRYKHLRCMRNLIHSQLFLGITIKNFLWMGMMIGTLYRDLFDNHLHCRILFTLHRFFQLSQFAWMFVEGLYLFIVVANALLTNRLRFKHCMLIGWGFPLVVTVTCILVNVLTSDDTCWQSGQIETAANTIETFSTCLLLLVNTAFMCAVIYTLVRKWKNSALTPYMKAIRALVILVPLLGGTYLMLFFSPHLKIYAVWVYFNSVIQSTLGFTVTVVYCFLNGDVRTSLAKSYSRWQDKQTLPSQGCCPRRRRSSYPIKREETETDTTTCQYSSRRSSRRVSEDTLSSSRRGSHIPETIMPIYLIYNKLRKTSPLAFPQPLMEKDKECIGQPTLVVAQQNGDNGNAVLTQLANNMDRLGVVPSIV